MIIDAHAHIFPAVNGLNGAGPTLGRGLGRITIGDRPPQQLLPPLSTLTEHTPEMLIAHMDWLGVDQAVLLQGPFYGECNAYVAAAAARYPDRLIAAAYFDPWAADSQRTFELTLSDPVFRAVKLECSVATGLFGFHPEASLAAPELAWLWEALERRRLVLTLDLGAIGSRSYQTEAVRAIAEAHPALRVVVAHLGQPRPAIDTDEQQRRLWQEQVELGRLPNVWFDCAALPAYTSPTTGVGAAAEGFPFATVARYLLQAVDRIGPAKILWGTDLPSLFAHATYRQLLDFARRPLSGLPPADLDLILGGNAAHVYGNR
jgi:predicted TIM-barrel fold metal-dependent hydrolase